MRFFSEVGNIYPLVSIHFCWRQNFWGCIIRYNITCEAIGNFFLTNTRDYYAIKIPPSCFCKKWKRPAYVSMMSLDALAWCRRIMQRNIHNVSRKLYDMIFDKGREVINPFVSLLLAGWFSRGHCLNCPYISKSICIWIKSIWYIHELCESSVACKTLFRKSVTHCIFSKT